MEGAETPRILYPSNNNIYVASTLTGADGLVSVIHQSFTRLPIGDYKFELYITVL